MTEDRLVKGSHVTQAERWVDDHLGKGTFKELTSSAGENWQIILPMAWYDVNVLEAALEQVSSKLRVSVEDITTEVARANAEADLTSIYRVFLRIAQPQRVLSMTPRLWTTYVKFGSALPIENEQGRYIGQCDGLDERLLGWACGCWRGFIPTTINMAGGSVDSERIIRRWRQTDGRFSIQLEVLYH